MSWIQTLEGKRFDLLSPNPDDIDPHTLCVVLARTCRFGGHCREFYSVAQHSLFVESLVTSDSLRLHALLHDAHEVYSGFGDVLRPAKWLSREVAEFLDAHTRRIDSAIAERFGLGFTGVDLMRHSVVKHADNVALATEARDLMEIPPCPWEELPTPHFDRIEPWGIDESFRRFQSRLYELWGE